MVLLYCCIVLLLLFTFLLFTLFLVFCVFLCSMGFTPEIKMDWIGLDYALFVDGIFWSLDVLPVAFSVHIVYA